MGESMDDPGGELLSHMTVRRVPGERYGFVAWPSSTGVVKRQLLARLNEPACRAVVAMVAGHEPAPADGLIRDPRKRQWWVGDSASNRVLGQEAWELSVPAACSVLNTWGGPDCLEYDLRIALTGGGGGHAVPVPHAWPSPLPRVQASSLHLLHDGDVLYQWAPTRDTALADLACVLHGFLRNVLDTGIPFAPASAEYLLAARRLTLGRTGALAEGVFGPLMTHDHAWLFFDAGSLRTAGDGAIRFQYASYVRADVEATIWDLPPQDAVRHVATVPLLA